MKPCSEEMACLGADWGRRCNFIARGIRAAEIKEIQRIYFRFRSSVGVGGLIHRLVAWGWHISGCEYFSTEVGPNRQNMISFLCNHHKQKKK